ncbi:MULTISPECIES: hypothetical protein [Faecalicoccus]|uniref:Uncharacterized protein n=1 Tax=Faecalicoccus pleomorphus TaxID=1323 RepID=A0AAW6CMA0_9FIRM|nr:MULTISPECIES: hypothetical protein [Faecalicoccus]MDB7979573.1 hypothetical protein [Faecalicoccus pleomorphus]MDB7981709.1 hypothetical protein [Faecalicoccus pleomorphus]MDB7983881.1 hypothetical protein [Faecalicoccus pleomorphus]MDY4277847.1 hypothetical protein [Faecalicoccus sp.]MDY4869301.1 hypothetical protein [Faecalicoccus sp.]
MSKTRGMAQIHAVSICMVPQADPKEMRSHFITVLFQLSDP